MGRLFRQFKTIQLALVLDGTTKVISGVAVCHESLCNFAAIGTEPEGEPVRLTGVEGQKMQDPLTAMRSCDLLELLLPRA